MVEFLFTAEEWTKRRDRVVVFGPHCRKTGAGVGDKRNWANGSLGRKTMQQTRSLVQLPGWGCEFQRCNEITGGDLTMRHVLHAEGFGVRLRPVQMEDAAFIVWLRNQDYVKGKVGDSAPDVASQQKWLETILNGKAITISSSKRLAEHLWEQTDCMTSPATPPNGDAISCVRKCRRLCPVACLTYDLAFARIEIARIAGKVRVDQPGCPFLSENLVSVRRHGSRQPDHRRSAGGHGPFHVECRELVAGPWSGCCPWSNLPGQRIKEWEESAEECKINP